MLLRKVRQIDTLMNTEYDQTSLISLQAWGKNNILEFPLPEFWALLIKRSGMNLGTAD